MADDKRFEGTSWAPASDILHPTGRCTCGGEGECDWCMSHCLYCGSSVWPHGEDEAADYEALGYPETVSRTVNLAAYHVVAGNIVTMAGYWAGSYGIEDEV